MKMNSLADYAACSLLKVIGPVIRALPKRASFALGGLIGEMAFLFDFKHREIAYANIRTAFGENMSPAQLRRCTKDCFRSFGQNFIEVFLIPQIDDAYARRYVRFEGVEHIREAFARKKGVLLCSVHAGSWELANILSVHLKIPFSMFVRDQKLPRVEKLLNGYRTRKGCRLIQRKEQTRELVRLLKENESTGLTIDQGGKTGTRVGFFGKEASMSSGAVRLGLKYGCAIVPVFFRRVDGPSIEITIGSPFELSRSGDLEKDVKDNLQRLVGLFEGHIRRYPHEYLWPYKVWKHSNERRILILSEGKTGHLRQSESLAREAARVLAERGIRSSVTTVVIKFRDRLSQALASPLNIISGRHICRGCLLCLRRLLDPVSFSAATRGKYDIIISCGSSLSAVNYILSRENDARSLCVMRPSLVSLDRFDLVVMPAHDCPHRARNVVSVEGALNLIDDDYLGEQAKLLSRETRVDEAARSIGILFGGDTKDFKLPVETVRLVCRQVNEAARRGRAEVLATTSRRTSPDAERAVKEECADARMLVIANEANVPFAVGGILGTCKVVVCSPESISMISEAASSEAYVVVFDVPGLGPRHAKFLAGLTRNRNVIVAAPERIAAAIERIFSERPARARLDNSARVRQALRKVISQ